MPETIPEKEGLVDREQLLDIAGRSRKRQMELAKNSGSQTTRPGRRLSAHRQELFQAAA